MGKETGLTMMLTIALPFFLLTGLSAADTTTMVQKNCMKCHQDFGKMENVLAGNLNNASLKSSSIQMKINNRLEMVTFTPATELVNVPDAKALKSGMAMRVHYDRKGNVRLASRIVVKPKIDVPQDQIIGVRDLVQLIEKGPEKGAYTLVDSRPGPGFLQGHIPTAISIPFPKMKSMLDKLPEEKDALVIFYCQGYR